MSHKVKWVIAHEPIDYFVAVAECFADEVNQRTDGAFEVEILSLTDYTNKYNDGKRITKADLMELLDNGTIEMSHIYTTWLADYNKDLHALDLPFLFEDHDHADRVLEGEIGTSLLASIEKSSNTRAMGFTYSGGYRIVPANFRAPNVDDWKGKEVRTSRSPVAIDMFKLLGANPHEHITLEEMGEYAKRGEIEAGESTFVRVLPLDQHKDFKYVNDTGHSLFLTSIIANKDWMDQFDEDTKKIMADAAFKASRMERRYSVADEPRIQGQLADEKVEVVKMSAEEIAKFKEISAPVYEMYKDYFTPGLVDSMLNEKSTKH